MFKWLLLLIVGLIVYGLVRSRAGASAAPHAKPSEPPPAIATVRCAQCGVHLDQREALQAESLTFCCEAHRKQWVSSH